MRTTSTSQRTVSPNYEHSVVTMQGCEQLSTEITDATDTMSRGGNDFYMSNPTATALDEYLERSQAQSSTPQLFIILQ
eukprot:gene13752-19656_t